MTGNRFWQTLTGRIRPVSLEGDNRLRRTGLRLAAQTVGLLLVMLLALEVIVYVITQHALLQSLETTLSTRAHPPPDVVGRILQPRLDAGPGGPPLPAFQDFRRSEASVVYLDTSLQPVGRGFGQAASTILDRAAAERALRTGKPQCCSEQISGGTSYLVYTDVLRGDGRWAIGVAQSSISTTQYHSTLQSLLQALLAVAFLGLIISGIIGTLLARRALRPIGASMQQQREFVAGAAHELRTPLAIMRTIGEVRLKDAATEDEQAALIGMLAQNSHLTQLVDDLSLLARGDSQALPIETLPVDLSALVGETIDEVEPLAEEQDVRLVGDLQDDVRVLGDTLRLRQLLVILLDNALKHAPPGSQVRAQLRVETGHARLSIEDAGVGIDTQHLSRIFDRFYRAEASRTGPGTGLGLAIAKWIVGAHGGEIHAGNAPEGGAVFTVTLPAPRRDKRHPQVVSSQSLAR